MRNIYQKHVASLDRKDRDTKTCNIPYDTTGNHLFIISRTNYLPYLKNKHVSSVHSVNHFPPQQRVKSYCVRSCEFLSIPFDPSTCNSIDSPTSTFPVARLR